MKELPKSSLVKAKFGPTYGPAEGQNLIEMLETVFQTHISPFLAFLTNGWTDPPFYRDSRTHLKRTEASVVSFAPLISFTSNFELNSDGVAALYL